MISQGTRNEEFIKTFKILKEIDYAENNSIALLYAYKQKDTEEFHQLAQEVAKDYRQGDFDPIRQQAIKSESRKFKQKNNKRMKRTE